ncbi:histidinol-phosphate transaminase [Kalmusia sp. IMI 367209]|nr:histidinol-phosphate transaminase [Kalmusia sp. IMI 367209]
MPPPGSGISVLSPKPGGMVDYPDEGKITLLDANENAFGPSIAIDETIPPVAGLTIQSVLDPGKLRLERYPDACFATCGTKAKRNPLTPLNICLGVGSDESIDGIIRAFCIPGKDKILITPPTYGMYHVSADVNDVGVVRVDLDVENGFDLRPSAVNEALSNDATIKVVFICSPGNPAGNLLSKSSIFEILQNPKFHGVVVVDEAYIDFAPPGSSFAHEVNEWPNLIVTQTVSKAFGLAGIRLGAIFAQHGIAQLLNNLKGPYNMSAPTVALAKAALHPEGLALMEKNRNRMREQQQRLQEGLLRIPGVDGILGGLHANFLLVRFLSKPADQGGIPDSAISMAVSDYLTNTSDILVRYRGKEVGCRGCLRISVGTKEQVDQILTRVEMALKKVYAPEIPTA